MYVVFPRPPWQTLKLDKALQQGLTRPAFEGSTHYGRAGPALAPRLAETFPWLKVVISFREPIRRARRAAGGAHRGSRLQTRQQQRRQQRRRQQRRQCHMSRESISFAHGTAGHTPAQPVRPVYAGARPPGSHERAARNWVRPTLLLTSPQFFIPLAAALVPPPPPGAAASCPCWPTCTTNTITGA